MICLLGTNGFLRSAILGVRLSVPIPNGANSLRVQSNSGHQRRRLRAGLWDTLRLNEVPRRVLIRAGRIRLDAPYLSRVVVQRLGLTIGEEVSARGGKGLSGLATPSARCLRRFGMTNPGARNAALSPAGPTGRPPPPHAGTGRRPPATDHCRQRIQSSRCSATNSSSVRWGYARQTRSSSSL